MDRIKWEKFFNNLAKNRIYVQQLEIPRKTTDLNGKKKIIRYQKRDSTKKEYFKIMKP